jgi:NADH-quinone oxidoreductase subunit N
LVASSNDFLSLYLALELQGLSTYILAGYSSKSAFSTEAGLKYFIVGSFSSGILLLGIGLIYLGSGTISFNTLFLVYSVVSPNYIVFFGLGLVIASLCFKLGAAPFHMWLPDIYEGSISIVSTFFAVVSKLGVFCIVLRFLYMLPVSLF